MPIVDISGLHANEAEPKLKVRKRIEEFFHDRLNIDRTATTVTFITDETVYGGITSHVMARMYSKRFMKMNQEELNAICDAVLKILEEEAHHVYNEVFPIPVLVMRGR